MLLEKIIDGGLFQFIDTEVTSWEEAIKISCEPLVREGIVDETYAQQLIYQVNEHGPYIVLLPNLAMPHTSQNAQGVTDTAIAFTRFKNPVSFTPGDETKDAQVFFTLAAANETKHLENMAGLFEMLSEEDTLSQVMEAQNLGDLQNIVATLKKHLI